MRRYTWQDYESQRPFRFESYLWFLGLYVAKCGRIVWPVPSFALTRRQVIGQLRQLFQRFDDLPNALGVFVDVGH